MSNNDGSKPRAPNDRRITVETTAQRLNRHPATVRRWIGQEDGPPFEKVHGRYLIWTSDLADWARVMGFELDGETAP